MKNYTCLLLIFTTLWSCNSLNVTTKSQSNKEHKIMRNITFIPEEFDKVELGYYKNSINACTPGYPNESMRVNTIFINIPPKIFFNIDVDSLLPIIPICAVYSISSRRSLKYSELSTEMLYIKRNNDGVTFSGGITEPYVPHKIIPA